MQSISKIPDRIKKEIYIQECAKIMAINEGVLFSTLAQILNKAQRDTIKKEDPNASNFQVYKKEQLEQSVDVQYLLERKIIQILSLYGHCTEVFEDFVLKENEEGELILEPIQQESKVFEKIYLDLQDDEMAFTNDIFKALYDVIMHELQQNDDFDITVFMHAIDQDLANEMTNILMDEERYKLDNWNKVDIFPKEKKDNIEQLVSETILNLRCFLIDKKIKEFQNQTKESKEESNIKILEDIRDYYSLKVLLTKKLNRVV